MVSRSSMSAFTALGHVVSEPHLADGSIVCSKCGALEYEALDFNGRCGIALVAWLRECDRKWSDAARRLGERTALDRVMRYRPLPGAPKRQRRPKPREMIREDIFPQ